MIERNFQIAFVARMALAEKQIQQNYRPLIAIHKWFARRPGTLFRALILFELGEAPVDQTYFCAHNFSDKHILDPFMGGGTTVVEANRLGCAVTAADINPMAWWIVRQEILDLTSMRMAKRHQCFESICGKKLDICFRPPAQKRAGLGSQVFSMGEDGQMWLVRQTS